MLGASESFLKHCMDRSLLIRLIKHVTAAGVANKLCQTRDNIVVDAFLIAYYGRQGLGGIRSTDQDCANFLVLRIADVTIVGDHQRSECFVL